MPPTNRSTIESSQLYVIYCVIALPSAVRLPISTLRILAAKNAGPGSNWPSKAVLKLSVKELANKAQTDAYFASLATKLGKTENIKGLGQGAFTTKNLSAVVRKDYKVLTVDISKLPANFGTPPDTRANIALNVAATIMGCWTGA